MSRDDHANTDQPWRLSSFSWVVWSVYFISWVAATNHVAAHPEWNLDGVFYSALMDPGAASTAVVHQRVYQEIGARVPPEAAAALTQGSDYRQRLKASVETFSFQLPFYQSKPLYLWLGRGLTVLGASLVLAPYIVSAFGFAAIGLLLPWLAIRAGARPLVAATIAAACVWLPELRGLGTLATPDALATALLVLGTIVALSDVRYALLPLSAAVLTRPDAAIVACAVIGVCSVCTRPPFGVGFAVFSCGLLLALAWVAVALTGGYPWSTVMRHTFMDRVLDEHDRALGFDMSDYAVALGRGMRGHMTDHPARFARYLGVAALAAGWAVTRGRGGRTRPALNVLCAVWLGTAAHFCVLPLLADRFFATAYVCSVALGCALLFPAPLEKDT
jgi:hypothetical protein